MHVRLLPLFPTQHFTADGEQQALYKATFLRGLERCNLSLGQAVGYQKAGSQAWDCSFNVCHAQRSINRKHNPAAQQPLLLTHQPDSSPVLTPTMQSGQRQQSYMPHLEGICLPAYATAWHSTTSPSLCYAGGLLKAISAMCFSQSCFIRAQLRGVLAVWPGHRQRRCLTQKDHSRSKIGPSRTGSLNALTASILDKAVLVNCSDSAIVLTLARNTTWVLTTLPARKKSTVCISILH